MSGHTQKPIINAPNRLSQRLYQIANTYVRLHRHTHTR